MKRFIGPLVSAIVAGAVIAAFGIFYFLICIHLPVGRWIAILFAAVAAGAIGILAAALLQRYHELKGGEEDDLGQY